MDEHVKRDRQDWQALRSEVRAIVYEALQAYEKSRALQDLRPLLLPEHCENARKEMFRVLVDAWSGRLSVEGESDKFEFRLYDIMYGLCRKGMTPAIAWGAAMESERAGVARVIVRPWRSSGGTRFVQLQLPMLIDPESVSRSPQAAKVRNLMDYVLVQISSETINKLIESAIPEPKPKWNRDTGILSYENIICKKFDGFADKQFAILDAFEKAGWPHAVRITDRMSRQTAQSLNATLNELSPIKFGFSEKKNVATWDMKKQQPRRR